MPLQGDDAVLQATSEAMHDRVLADQALAVAEKEHKKEGSDTIPFEEKTVSIDDDETHGPDYPTPDQKATLKRVPSGMNLVMFTVAFLEFSERFSYYGSIAVLTNFIQFPLPEGSKTGAIKGLTNVNTPGALGKGQQSAFALTTFLTFWVYCTPLLGAYVADAHLGRFKTISWAVLIVIIGHILMIICAIPSVITNSNASLGILVIALVIMGLGTGTFKSNISPLIAEQLPARDLRVVSLKNGEQVIQDPALTVSRVMMYFYLLVNAGALAGQIGMVYAEQDIGFWLSFTIPTIVFCLAPFVLWWGNSRYNKLKPQGSIFAQAIRLVRFGLSYAWTANPAQFLRNIRDPEFWERIKPSRVEADSPDGKPAWMTFDDQWVSEVRRGIRACNVFLLFPFYWICYNQITSNLTSQAATMERNGIPNDLINNLNPITLVIMIPIMDLMVYPALRKAGIQFTAIKKITLGFFLASIAMVCAAVTQHYIYQTSPCGYSAATCEQTSPLNVWIQTPTYVLIGISEIFASITGLEYAFNKAPQNMRSMVTAIFLIQQSFSAAIAQAFVALSTDPRLVINYGVFAGLSFVGGIAFWLLFRKLDKEENELNDMRRKENFEDIRKPIS